MKRNAWKQYPDADILARVTIRLIEPEEKPIWDELIRTRHYLKNANLVGRQLRYVAEVDARWARCAARAAHARWPNSPNT